MKDIHQRQLDDPFYDIQNMRNSVKLENLSLWDRIPIKETLKNFGLDKLIVGKAVTIASSSKKDDEQEIELSRAGATKLQVPENKEDGESDSNKPFQDDTNLDITANIMKAEIDSSFNGLIKEWSKKAEDSEWEDELNDTAGVFQSLDSKKLNLNNELSRTVKDYSKTLIQQSKFGSREIKSLKETKSNDSNNMSGSSHHGESKRRSKV